MITGVILNWKRPANVQRIVAGWLAGDLVTEVLLAQPVPDLLTSHLVDQ